MAPGGFAKNRCSLLKIQIKAVALIMRSNCISCLDWSLSLSLHRPFGLLATSEPLINCLFTFKACWAGDLVDYCNLGSPVSRHVSSLIAVTSARVQHKDDSLLLEVNIHSPQDFLVTDTSIAG